MKIAVSGAVCTGKTTLGRALAERLDLPFIEEHMGGLFASGRKRTPEQFAAAVVECLELKHAKEAEATRFVVDRCPLDLINFWQVNQLSRRCAGHDIQDLCARYLADYDFVILTPLGDIPLVEENPDKAGQRRNTNPWVRFKGSSMITGLAFHFLDVSRIVRIPNEMGDHEERLAFVLDAVGKGSGDFPPNP